jgi:hypothetical protein
VSALIEDTHAVSTLLEDADDGIYQLPHTITRGVVVATKRDIYDWMRRLRMEGDWLTGEDNQTVLAAYMDAYSHSAFSHLEWED